LEKIGSVQMKISRSVVIMICAVLIMVGVSWVVVSRFWSAPDIAAERMTIRAQKREIRQELTLGGIATFREVSQINPPIGGLRIRRVMVVPGQAVKAGQALAEFESPRATSDVVRRRTDPARPRGRFCHSAADGLA
jgi:multidrug efflux pump subunit AcrA (membrane-fusion protein)